ncbi:MULTISPECIES: hypothetical protein [Stappiaceae]|uniref:hypothetical protein n=1 Tax=Stappiaceae TaxID=2821832 RepID=UPI001AD9E9D7|nr:hypothetical protein [Labrenzia sp. R4_1]MBO9427049.1 hypothetical protein [Labrenzia sp. R4_1]
MSIMFDTLGYSEHLQNVGIPAEQARNLAMAAKGFASEGPATKAEMKEVFDTVNADLYSRGGIIRIATILTPVFVISTWFMVLILMVVQ